MINMRRIAVASGKGGVGRTTIVASLGIALASLGKETIIIDGSLTTPDLALLFKLEKSVYTLNDALAGDAMFIDVMHPGPKHVKIVPAAVALEQIRKARPERLPELMRQVPKKTDFVLVDVPSGLSRETVSAMRAGQEVLLVATPEMTSISDAMKTRLIAEFLGLAPIGVVLNRVRREEFELTRNEIKNVPVLAEIPEDEKVRQALKQGKPLLELDSKSPAAKAIKELARKLLKVKGSASKTTISKK
ncbi:MAG: septum site-determining protein MinD [Hadesarchaea archaeon]|nr:MAG: septum site-determining protein MinD [Hadesarchaea archaeon]